MVRSSRAPPTLWFSPGQASRCPRLLPLEPAAQGVRRVPLSVTPGPRERASSGTVGGKTDRPLSPASAPPLPESPDEGNSTGRRAEIPDAGFRSGKRAAKRGPAEQSLGESLRRRPRAVQVPGAQTATYTPASHSPTRHRLRLHRLRRRRRRRGHRTATAVPPPRPWPRPRARCVREPASRRGRFPPCALLLVNFISSFLIHP